jgi:hypothetical protein
VAILRKSCRNASCVRSSASAVFPTIRRHSEYTRRLCDRYSRSNAAASPCWARRISSASGTSPGSTRLVRATLPVGTHPSMRCVVRAGSCTSRSFRATFPHPDRQRGRTSADRPDKRGRKYQCVSILVGFAPQVQFDSRPQRRVGGPCSSL